MRHIPPKKISKSDIIMMKLFGSNAPQKKVVEIADTEERAWQTPKDMNEFNEAHADTIQSMGRSTHRTTVSRTPTLKDTICH